MAQTPPQPPGGRKTIPPVVRPLEDFNEFEGDPTNINQIPHPNQPPPQQMQVPPQHHQPRPHGHSSMPPPQQNFAQPSPTLSHLGAPLQQPQQQPQQAYGSGAMPYTNPGAGMMPQPGPNMTQIGPPMS